MKNKLFLIIFASLLLWSCKSTPPKYTPPEGSDYYPPFSLDTIYNWKLDSVTSVGNLYYYEYPPIENILNLSDVKKTFYKRNGTIRNKKARDMGYLITLNISPISSLVAKMQGNINYYTLMAKYGNSYWGEINFDTDGNLIKISLGSMKEPQYFEKGTGYYKNVEYLVFEEYVTVENARTASVNRSSNLDNPINYHLVNDSTFFRTEKKSYIESEGYLQNNYKVGEWKYYNSDGSINAVRHYKLSDKEDIRFPNCLFNKIDPCYSCDE